MNDDCKKIIPCLVCLIFITCFLYSNKYGVAGVDDIQNILPERARAKVMNEWLKWRLENILPRLMRRERIDMWLVINREYNEDPVYLTLVPEPVMAARRTSILVFFDRGEKHGIERLSGSFYSMGDWYQGTWKDKKKTQFQSLAAVIKKYNPRRIGINVSSDWTFGDGLTVTLKNKLERALDPKYASRLVSAERLCIAWLETRSPHELSLYRHVCGVAHDLIAEFFSNRVIIPDITTTDEVRWWIRQKINDIGLDTWFHPSISIQRHQKKSIKYNDKNKVIRRGDLLHCDVGIVYLGLCTDMQWQAYVCKIGENDAPGGLKKALKRANRVAEIFMGEFKLGRTGNKIVGEAMRKAREEDLNPLIYSHPVGFHGHAAGPPMEARDPKDAPEGYKKRGEYPLYLNTVFAIEFSSTTAVPEWDGQNVRIGFEEQGVFTKNGCRFIDGHQTKFFLIK